MCLCWFGQNIVIGSEDRTDNAILWCYMSLATYKTMSSHQNVIIYYALPMVFRYQFGLNIFVGSEEGVPKRLIRIATFVYDPGDLKY